MIRKSIIFLLMLTAFGTLLVWVWSYDRRFGYWSHSGVFLPRTVTKGEYIYKFGFVDGLFGFENSLIITEDMVLPNLTKKTYGAVGFRVGAIDQPVPSSAKTNRIASFLFIPLWFPFLLFSLYPTIVLGRRYQRRWKGLCLHCGYDLTGNESGVCPECGERIECAK